MKRGCTALVTTQVAIVAVLTALSLGALAAYAQMDQQVVTRSVVEVRGENRRGRDFPIAKGFVINTEGYVVTVGQRSLKAAKKIKVVPLPDDGAAYEVQQPLYHPSLELAVLPVPALRLEPLSLDRMDAKDQPVFVPLPDAWMRGSADGLVERPVRAYGFVEHNFVRHNTDVSWEGYGAPLLNERGAVIGVNHPNPDLPANRLSRKSKPAGRAFAVPAAELEKFLNSRNISFNLASVQRSTTPVAVQQTEPKKPKPIQDEESVSRRELQAALAALNREREAREDAETIALQARQKATNMERLAKEAESNTEVAENEKRAARQAARLANAAAEEAEKTAAEAAQRAAAAEQLAAKKEEEAKAEATAREAESETARRNLALIIGAGLAILLTLAGAWFAYSRRRARQLGRAEARAKDAEQAAQRVREEAARPSRAPFDCLLEGRAPNGRRFTLKVPAETLGTEEGVVIGRNPRYAKVVVDQEGISREHAKLTVVEGVLRIEDLNSTNGTYANNMQLRPGQQVVLSNGSVVRLGSVSFTVSLT